MAADRPVEILALPPKLHELFDGHVSLGAVGDALRLKSDALRSHGVRSGLTTQAQRPGPVEVPLETAT